MNRTLPIRIEHTWIRLAGHAKMIRASGKYPWRCYIAEDPEEIPLTHWNFAGTAQHENVIPGSDPGGDTRGLVAWIDCFGDIEIGEDHVARILLKIPPQ